MLFKTTCPIFNSVDTEYSYQEKYVRTRSPARLEHGQLKPHLHALKNQRGMSKYAQRDQIISVRHYPFTRPKQEGFFLVGYGSNFYIGTPNFHLFFSLEK